MSALFQLFSLLSLARSGCVLPCGKPESKCCDPHTVVCPELVLIEPSCNNEILAKFDIGLFLLHEKEAKEKPEAVVSKSKEESSSEEHHETLVPLKILKFHERKDACCTNNSVVVTFVKPVIRPTHDCAFLILSPKGDYCHRIPHVFATTFSNHAGIEQKIIGNHHQVVYKIPLRDIDSLIVSITDLGIANTGKFTKSGNTLNVVLESDIFTHGPLVSSVHHLPHNICLPASYSLPNNMMLRLAAIQKSIRDSITVPSVDKPTLKKMAIAAFINELRHLFNCHKKIEKCEKDICEKVVADYCVFVTSCVKVLAYCEEKNEKECCFVQPISCSEENKYASLCQGISGYANKCHLANVKVSSEINVLFSEVCPMLEFKQEEPECVKLVEIEAESSSTLESEAAALNDKKKALAQKKKPAVAVKTSTSVSTYGWYVAGGVVAVSVAVAVYVFAL